MTSLTKKVLITSGLILLFMLSVIATHAMFTSKAPGANDFYPRWKGSQLFWQQGISPYSDEVSQAIQTDVYGRLAEPDEDQLLFVYPFYTIFMILPLVWLPLSYSWIQAIWLVAIQFSLIGAVLITLRLIGWRMPPWLLGMTLLWTIVFYNSARTIILGQFTAFIFLWFAAAYWALKQDRDALAGILIALTTIKPQVILLAYPLLFLWIISQRRWRFVTGFAVTMALLAGISFLWLPSWFAGFVEQVLYYPAYTVTPPPLWVITGYYFPQLGKPVETGLSVMLVLYLLYQLRYLPKLKVGSDHFLILLGLSLIVTNMIIVRTATTNYLVLYIPMFWGLKLLAERIPRGNLLVSLFLLLSTVSMWTLFLSTISGDFEHPIMYLPIPIGLLIMLVWARSRLRLPAQNMAG